MKLKALATLCVLLLTTCLMTSCQPPFTSLDYFEISEGLSQIFLISYDNGQAAKIGYEEKALPYDLSKEHVLEILDNTKHEEFLSLLCDQPIKDLTKKENREVRFQDRPIGQCIKLTYTDGSFAIYSSDNYFNVMFDENGIAKTRAGRFKYYDGGDDLSFRDLIEKYFETYIRPEEKLV